MIAIDIEHLITHECLEYEISRVPCIGERVNIGDDSVEVVQVHHHTNVNPDNETVALIRVK